MPSALLDTGELKMNKEGPNSYKIYILIEERDVINGKPIKIVSDNKSFIKIRWCDTEYLGGQKIITKSSYLKKHACIFS